MGTYEVLALRYGRLRAARGEIYVDLGAADPDEVVELAYYFWAAVGDERVVLVDTGFDPEVGTRRGRETLVPPLELLHNAGIGPGDVTDVVVTHFHYDHIGNVRAFPNAMFHVAAAEYDHWTSVDRGWGSAAPVEPAEVAELERLHRAGRVTLLPDVDRFPIVGGIVGVRLPGHTPGQIAVRIPTRDVPVLLTSDAAHTAEEIEHDRPFHVFTDLGAMRAGLRTIRSWIEAGDVVVVPGHEPAVAEEFPLWRGVEAVYALAPRISPNPLHHRKALT